MVPAPESNHSPEYTSVKVLQSHSAKVINAIRDDRLLLSISPLLGCDYLFINHSDAQELFSGKHLVSTVQELIELLRLSPRHSLIIAVTPIEDGKLIFTRYDYVWHNRHIGDILATHIIHTEQLEFMQMMFACSSLCEEIPGVHIANEKI